MIERTTVDFPHRRPRHSDPLTFALDWDLCPFLYPQVADAVHLAKRTLAKINQNLVWAFGYNVIAIPLAAGALLPAAGICLTPSISGALMGLSSLAVVGNSLLLQWEVRNMGQAQGQGQGQGQALAQTGGTRQQQLEQQQPRQQQPVVSAGVTSGTDGDGSGAGAVGAGAASSRGAPQMLASLVSSAAAAATAAGGGGGKQPPQAPPAIGGAAGAGAG